MLTNIIPARYRQIVYVLLSLVALGFAAWQASDGDWTVAALAFVSALVHAGAASNTSGAVTIPTLTADDLHDALSTLENRVIGAVEARLTPVITGESARQTDKITAAVAAAQPVPAALDTTAPAKKAPVKRAPRKTAAKKTEPPK
ncbi:MAG: hypothetical protein FWE71_07605 [Nocardioidaceae bacterium]|nr:hypothetical protein [Nocardioidaceae bacterium]MCL2611853.1 hypothetical protein [Nocardioidaceae bacterium]